MADYAKNLLFGVEPMTGSAPSTPRIFYEKWPVRTVSSDNSGDTKYYNWRQQDVWRQPVQVYSPTITITTEKLLGEDSALVDRLTTELLKKFGLEKKEDPPQQDAPMVQKRGRRIERA